MSKPKLFISVYVKKKR